jgi:hypothetical protein
VLSYLVFQDCPTLHIPLKNDLYSCPFQP